MFLFMKDIKMSSHSIFTVPTLHKVTNFNDSVCCYIRIKLHSKTSANPRSWNGWRQTVLAAGQAAAYPAAIPGVIMDYSWLLLLPRLKGCSLFQNWTKRSFWMAGRTICRQTIMVILFLPGD